MNPKQTGMATEQRRRERVLRRYRAELLALRPLVRRTPDSSAARPARRSAPKTAR